MASSEQALITAAIQETRDLHVFFEGWLAGTLADDSFARVEQALGEEFSVVAPTGARSDRAATLSSVHAARGLRRHPDHPFRIWIEAEVPLFVSAGLIALGYDECQSIAGKPTRRRSTALFRVDAQGPNGLRWATLHETWVTPPA